MILLAVRNMYSYILGKGCKKLTWVYCKHIITLSVCNSITLVQQVSAHGRSIPDSKTFSPLRIVAGILYKPSLSRKQPIAVGDGIRKAASCWLYS